MAMRDFHGVGDIEGYDDDETLKFLKKALDDETLDTTNRETICRIIKSVEENAAKVDNDSNI